MVKKLAAFSETLKLVSEEMGMEIFLLRDAEWSFLQATVFSLINGVRFEQGAQVGAICAGRHVPAVLNSIDVRLLLVRACWQRIAVRWLAVAAFCRIHASTPDLLKRAAAHRSHLLTHDVLKEGVGKSSRRSQCYPYLPFFKASWYGNKVRPSVEVGDFVFHACAAVFAKGMRRMRESIKRCGGVTR